MVLQILNLGMCDIIDSEIVESTALDKNHAFDEIDLNDLNPRLFSPDEQQTRELYFEKCFDESKTTKWEHEKNEFCCHMEVNGATDDLLRKAKNSIKPTLKICRRLSQVENGVPMLQSDFLNIWFNCDFFQALQDFMNECIDDVMQHASETEVLQMI